jgi:hypothetical protein
VHPLFLSEAVESAKRPHMLHESKALNMGIAELEPRHLSSKIMFGERIGYMSEGDQIVAIANCAIELMNLPPIFYFNTVSSAYLGEFERLVWTHRYTSASTKRDFLSVKRKNKP